MQVDLFTVLLFGLFVKLLLGGLFAAYWLNNRGSPWFGWWGVSLASGSLTAALYMFRGSTQTISPSVWAIRSSSPPSPASGRARAPSSGGVRCGRRCGIPALWLAVCLVPGFLESVPLRIVVSSSLVAAVLVCGAGVLARPRGAAPLAMAGDLRLPLVGAVLCGANSADGHAAVSVRRAADAAGLVGAFNLTVIAHTLLLVVLFVAMSKERLELEQRTKAQTDPLTGALNRRAFMARGERLVARHRHEGAPLSLLFLDLDHFKSLNDRFGHAGGDDVLTCFVGLVNSCIRPTDFLFRVGGEEFCCLLPHTGAEPAHHIAERIRHQVETASVIVAGMPVKAPSASASRRPKCPVTTSMR